jgi:outer membrane protein assembly factor BamB
MLPLRGRFAPHQRARFYRAALWLAVGATLVGVVSACTISFPGQNQSQRSAAPPHTVYVSYWRAQKAVTAPGDLQGNALAFIVAAMTTSDGKRVWQSTLLDNVASSQGSSARYHTLISGPIVYVAGGLGQRGIVAALDAYTGTILWKHESGPDVISDMQAANGTLYLWVGLHELQALDGSSGRLLWRLATGDRYTLGSVAIAGQAVYIVEQSFGPERLGDPDPATYTFVRALRARDGKDIWQGSVEKTDNTVGYRLQADEQRVYLLKPSYDTGLRKLPGTVSALRAQDGGVLWTYTEASYTVDDFTLFAHSLVGQTLYLVAHTHVTALDTQTGTQRSSYETPFSLYLFMAPDRLYGAGAGRDDRFCSLNLSDGTKRWCSAVQPTTPSHIVAGTQNLYFLGYLDSDEKVMVVRQSDGQVVAQYQIDDPKRTFPGAFGGVD